MAVWCRDDRLRSEPGTRSAARWTRAQAARRPAVGPARRGRDCARAEGGGAGRAHGRGSARSRGARRGASGPRRRRRSAADYGIDELVAGAAPDAPLLVVLDGVEDPHNVGAILRSVDAAGAHGVVRQARHAASLDGIVAKASAGAVTTVRIATVVNIARALDELKEAGVWTVGLAGDVRGALRRDRPDGADGDRARGRGERACAGWSGSAATGWRRFRCAGQVESLNVSVAAGVMLFEAARQRRSRSVV